MKTLSFTVGLLLLITLYYCAATLSTGSCCYKLFPKKIPKAAIMSITKTPRRCLEKAFVFNTPRGKVCVSQTLDWAKKAYEQQQYNNECFKKLHPLNLQ
ncbi:C-C motif chemokine 4-like [Anabas testudineus]|uniref:C-C motif chemokine 4-like n=1 Tax=Anabas testudineus TaxID=64144 RepID=UPI000E4598E0|nr:C-C motif chemokine 4-like [Anabas testudineus]